jgi:hypothetical protein
VLTLPVGPHVIEARKSPLIAQKKAIEVTDQQQVKVRFELLPATPLPPMTGSDAAVGSGSGSGVPPAAGLGSGSGSGAAAPPAAGSAALATGSAAAGAGSNVPIEPPRPPSGSGTIDIATTAPHAIAYVDGAPIRDAPCVLELESGEHVVAVYTAGMVPAETIVRVEQGKRQRVELTPKVQRRRLDVPAQ